MPLSTGTRLGPYSIEAPLGAGGMGEVYRARDTRLGRDVALKILPETFADDPDRLLRFEQESLAVAALNHPNILAIYDVGHHGRVPFLVTELLEGESLRALLDCGALPQRKVIDYGVQIAHGLAAAHDKGIVHRDLKPENLFLTRNGRIKILDFGLAKLASPTVEPDGATIARSNTAVGVVMGTASYMAPEQVQGKAVDARTDIFALGAVLFEMLSGLRAFHRDTAVETMTAVLKDDPPDFPNLQPAIAPALDRIVRRCLEKNPEERFQSVRDLSFALGVLSGTEISGATRAAQAAAGFRKKWLWASLPLALLLIVAAGWLLPRRAPEFNRMEFAIPLAGEVNHFAISEDGRMLAFVSPDEKTGAPMLFVQLVGSPHPAELSGTEGASYPFWSPDDAFVAFFANGKLQKIAAAGGAAQMLAKVTFARGGSWSSKNVIVYAPDPAGVLWRVNADGSNNAPLTGKLFEKAEDSHRWPLFLPDGDHFLYLAANFGSGPEYHDSSIYLTTLQAVDKKLLVTAHSNPGYAAGQLFWVDEKKSLRTAALNVKNGSVSGDSLVVGDAVGYQPSVYRGAFSVAENGTLVYSKTAAAALSILTWHDRSGKELGRVGEIGVQANPALAPDGSRVALDITDLKSSNLDVWIDDLKKGTSTRFTFNPAEETDGIWSRDGATIAYRTVATGAGVEIKNANGMAAPRTLTSVMANRSLPHFDGVIDLIPNSWSLDGKQLLCSIQSRTASTLVLVPATGGDPAPFFSGQSGDQTNGQISPDGKWMAYASNESGDWEVYVTTFPGAVGKWQLSRGGGEEPRWRGDGKEVFYLGPTGILMAVPAEIGETFSSGTPSPLFQVRGRAQISSTDRFTYDVTKDGQRFLVNQYVKPEQIAPLTIVQHALADPPR